MSKKDQSQCLSDPSHSQLFMRVFPSLPPLPSSLPLSRCQRPTAMVTNNSGGELHHPHFVVSFPCRRISQIPTTPTLYTTKVLAFALRFFLYKFYALASLNHIPTRRIPDRFASQSASHGFGTEVKARSLPRLILWPPHSPFHAPDSCS